MGEAVVSHRSSWVRRIENPSLSAFIKTYEYASWNDRLSNWGKWTAPLRRSRAARECQALNWLRSHDFVAPSPIACFEWRTYGFLRRATLLTEACAGEPADQILARVPADRRDDISTAIGTLVAALHHEGFRDRNLDLRNLLVHQTGDQIRVAKIDSPRFRLVKPGVRRDRLAQADWQRLLPQLATYDVADAALAAAAKYDP